MNILERTNHNIYKANLDLSIIRSNIKKEIELVNKRIDDLRLTDYTIADMSNAEMSKVHLEIFLDKIG